MFDPSAPTNATDNYILALDAGGTMTDAILVKPDGGFKVGKSITRRTDEARSYVEAVADAASAIGADVDSVHRNCAVALYCGTAMLNTILTGTGKRVG
ncbi:MAG TPA: hydantoinase/oxoprolinase N-terminal domain-containing protein, partial [Candidatus Binataceae bacterium]|nr:hydantoinase/oxoprolinase N-terminal domain-containing protein [Candidatus Binataceae bacterium]